MIVAPSRARGLKLRHKPVIVDYRCRAFTGAWIETNIALCGSMKDLGRAFTGAWIETVVSCFLGDISSGRAFTGAWIETDVFSPTNDWLVVAPSRARGLKQFPALLSALRILVAPSRARGLKQLSLPNIAESDNVAPSRARGLKRPDVKTKTTNCRRAFTGAWIETRSAA